MITLKHGKLICVQHSESSSTKCKSCREIKIARRLKTEDKIIKEVIGWLTSTTEV